MEKAGTKLPLPSLEPKPLWIGLGLVLILGGIWLSLASNILPVYHPRFPMLGGVCLVAGLLLTLLILLDYSRRHRRAQRHLWLTQEQFSALSSNVPGVIFQWYQLRDGQFGFNYCSPRCEEIFGFKAEDAVQDWSCINIHPADASRWAESIRQSSASLSDWFFEGRLITPSGDVKWWRGVAKPVRSSEREILFNGIMLDISEAKEAEREVREARRNAEKLGTELLLVNQNLNEINGELKRANQQKNEFLGIAAHDLKNPLGGIVGFAGAMRQSLEEPEYAVDQAELADMTLSIEQSARHMLHIISELLNTALLESQHLRLDRSECDISILAQSVASLNEHGARQKKIEVICQFQPDCVAEIDVQRVQELIDNLLSNAIKYSPAERRVWIGSKRAGEVIRLWVRDEGPGLTDEDKRRLFGKFQKLSARPTGGESSTGLGLSIAKSIADVHGGRIWAESEQGQGATFFVELPVHAVEVEQYDDALQHHG